MDAKKVGKNIALLRKENNMTQKELAAKLNVIDKTISRWECGYGLPDIATLPKIAEVFNVSIEMLIGEDEKVYSDEAQSQIPSAAKKTFPLAIVLSIILIVAVIAATASVITISAGKPKREISAYCWDVAFQSDADYVFITAFGNDEVMSLELYEGSDYFVCQETWVESEEAKFLNCAVEGSYKVEGNTVYFYPDYVIDPDGTAKLRTHKILGLEDFHAEIVSGTEGYESVIFYADAKNTSTSVFGRWTKFANYYSRSESEVYFERVRGSRLTYMQQVKLPVFALKEMRLNVPIEIEVSMPRCAYYVGEIIPQSSIAVNLVYADGTREDVSEKSAVDLSGKQLTTDDRLLRVSYSDGTIEKSAEVPITVGFGRVWERLPTCDADYTFFTHYNNKQIISFGLLELYGDETEGRFVYRENYGRDSFVSAAVVMGTYKTVDGEIRFVCTGVISSKTSSRFAVSAEGAFYVAQTDGLLSDISFSSSADNKNFFGYNSEGICDTSYSRTEGEVYFERVTGGALSERAESCVETYSYMIIDF